METERQQRERFVLRRAFRSPTRTVVRAEVMQAFGASKTAASALLKMALQTAAGALVREGNKVAAPPWATPPPWADETDLMDALNQGRTGFAQTGLRASELAVNFSSWSASLPAVPGAMTQIVQACVRKRPIYIRYVGLKAADQAHFRRVFPVALERMGDQWRLVAHDLGIEGWPVRIFVLARISGAMHDERRAPKGFIACNPIDARQKVQVNWDLRLTADQREALRNELGIDSAGVVHVNSREVHEFLIRYGGCAVAGDVVWPPLRTAAR